MPSLNPLSADQLAFFSDNGFLVMDFKLENGLIEAIVDKLDPLYPASYRVNPERPERMPDAWKKVDEVRQLAVQPSIMAALRQIWGREPEPFQTLNFPVGTRQMTHSDTIHFNSSPAGFLAGVWVALEDIDEENGPLIYFPRSHKLPELTMQDLGLGTGREFYPAYEKAIERFIDENSLEPRLGAVRKGEAIIWHGNLLHGGHVQQDLSRSRHSQVTHYYFEDCEYYVPMESEPDNAIRKYPDWITEFPWTPWRLESFRVRLLGRFRSVLPRRSLPAQPKQN